jgi:hypothetical protein
VQGDPTWKIVGAGDFSGDGAADVLWQKSSGQSAGLVGAWITVQGQSPTWAPWSCSPYAEPDPSVWSVIGVGDVNADGTSDVLWRDQSTGEVGTWQILNSQHFGGFQSFGVRADSNWHVVGVGDFSGGGSSDVLWRNQSTGVIDTWLIRNAGFDDSAVLGTQNNIDWEVVASGDYNANWFFDVLWHNQSTGVVGTWLIENAEYSGWAQIGNPIDPAVWQVVGRQGGSFLRAASVVTDSDAARLTQSQLQAIVMEAINRWAGAGLDGSTLASLARVEFVVADLSGACLGEAQWNRIYIDANAAGHGWFVDDTAAADEEFAMPTGNTRSLLAVDPQAVDRIDLLTVVEHELGHIAGFDDLDALADNLMSGVLGIGVRRTPYQNYVAAALTSA